MLMEVKKEFKVAFLSIKYSLMREMLNKTTFLTIILFMLLNNASFIIQWVVLYSIKDSVGGYTFKQVLLLWGLAAGTYGFSRFFFKKAFSLSETINSGGLDAYLVQPKNVLISSITHTIEPSAIGDLIYGYIMLFIFGFSIKSFMLFTLFCITGGLILVSISIIVSSLSFWFGNTEMVADSINNIMVNFATYPDGIFKGFCKVMLYTIIPVGLADYIPIHVMTKFDLFSFLLIIGVTIVLIVLAFVIFYKGLKRYSSSSLMNVRM